MEDWKKRLGSYDSMNEAIFVTIDGETIYTIDNLVDFIEQEIDKAREEGREEIRQLLRDKKQMQDYLKKNPRFYKGEKIPTATSNLLKTKEDEK